MKYLSAILLLIVFSCTCSAQVVVNGNPPSGESGKSYSTTFTASGGAAPYTYYVTNPPDFLSMDQNTGVLSGTLQSPVIGDSYTFTVTAFDATMAQGQSQYTITVSTGGGGKSSDGGGCTAARGTGLRWLLLAAFILLLVRQRKRSC